MPEYTAAFGFTAPTKMGQSKSVKHRDKNWSKGLRTKPGGNWQVEQLENAILADT